MKFLISVEALSEEEKNRIYNQSLHFLMDKNRDGKITTLEYFEAIRDTLKRLGWSDDPRFKEYMNILCKTIMQLTEKKRACG